MYLKDAMTEYSFDCRIRKLSPKTIDNYMEQFRYCQTYLEEVCGITHVEEIRRTHIKHFLCMMEEKKRKLQSETLQHPAFAGKHPARSVPLVYSSKLW